MLELPRASFVVEDEVVEFATEVIEACDEAGRLEDSLERSNGRPRALGVRAVLVALLVLAMDGRPLHLTEVTRLLYSRLSARGKERLQVSGEASSHRCFLARYRCVRYLFHRMLDEMDPSPDHKNRVMPVQELVAKRRTLTVAEVQRRRRALESFVNSLLEASCQVLGEEELSGYDGSAGLDATVVPLYSRGPSKSSGTCASDPDGGWYVRDGDRREEEDHKGRRRSKVAWALEATIVTMARRPGAAPSHPNLALGLVMARPGEDPGGVGVRVLASLSSRGYKPGFLGADRGYTQVLAEHFHLPVRAIGYRIVMDYKGQDLGRQANSGGAVLVDGCFYCPAMPEALVSASGDHRAQTIDEATFAARVKARSSYRLVRKSGPDNDGYERYSCPAVGGHPHVVCPLRPTSSAAVGKVPVLRTPLQPPKVCTQQAITIAPDVGARHRQELAFGTEEWARVYATCRNTIEGWNGYVKDAAHEDLAAPSRRRVRGIAAQSIFCAFLLMAANLRKIRTYRELVADRRTGQIAERARRRRMSIAEYRSPP
jgi:hypothetical protein